MNPKILILEDDCYRIRTFIEFLGHYEITITESYKEACILLSNAMFDYVFLNAKGSKVAKFIKNELNYSPSVFIHTWDLLTAESMLLVIPTAQHKLFNSEEFYEINRTLW